MVFAFSEESIRQLRSDHEQLRGMVEGIYDAAGRDIDTEVPWRYAELTATSMDPGGSGEATLMKYDFVALGWVTGSQNVTIYDHHNRAYGISGEKLPVRLNPISGRWEIIGEHGLIRRGKAAAEISVDGSASVSIWTGSGAGADSTANVTAHLRWMDGGEAVSSGKEVLVQYIPDMTQWLVIGAECE